MVSFESEFIVNRDTFMEIKWHIPMPKEKMLFAMRPLSGILITFGGIALQIYVVSVIGFISVIAFILSYPWHLNRIIKRELERMNESIGRYEIKGSALFMNESIKTNNVDDNYSSEIKYSHFNRFIETKNLYVLFTKSNLFIAIKKTSLTAKSDEEFVPFIKDRCKNIRFRK